MNTELAQGVGITFTISIYNDPWLDNGLENFYQILKNVQNNTPDVLSLDLSANALQVKVNDEKRFVDLTAGAIAKWRDDHLFYWDADKATGVKTNKKKAFAALQYDKKQGNLNSVKEKILKDNEAPEMLQLLIEETKAAKLRKTCVMCGRKFHNVPTNLKQAIYPMVTKIKSLSGVRTTLEDDGSISGMTDNYRHLCPYCYVIGAVEWCDPGIVYRSFLDEVSVVLLPVPRLPDLRNLHEIKRKYVRRLHPQEKVSNVRVQVFRPRKKRSDPADEADDEPEEHEEFPIGKHTLLLGFYERILRDIASETKRIDFKTVQQSISDAWLAMEVPEGTVKNIRTYRVVVEEKVVRLLARLIEQGVYPYGYFFGPLWLSNDEGKPVNDDALTRARKEGLAQAFMEDEFDKFAIAFGPRRRTHLALSAKAGETLEQIIKVWRWSGMALSGEDLETVKKAARAVAKIAGKNLSIYYAVEKARTTSDLLEALQEVAHKLVGFEQKDLQYVSVDSLERFTEMLHLNTVQFQDLKNTLAIFAAVEYGRQTFRGGAQSS